MRLTTLLTLLTLFGVACLIFDSVGTIDSTSGNFISPGLNTTDTNSTTAPYLIQYFTNPSIGIFGSSFWLIFVTLFLGTIGLSTVFSGLFRFTTSDAVTFTPWVALILAYGDFWISTIFSFVQRELNSYMAPGNIDPLTGHAAFALMPTVLALAFVAIPAINLIMSVLQMWRTGFTNT